VFRHVVLFRWKDDVSDEQKQAFHAALLALPRQIDVVRGYHVGHDVGLADANHDFAIVAEFDCAEDYPVYRDHPVHEAFKIEHYFPLVSQRAAVQYQS
jgi:hypothetical protein